MARVRHYAAGYGGIARPRNRTLLRPVHPDGARPLEYLYQEFHRLRLRPHHLLRSDVLGRQLQRLPPPSAGVHGVAVFNAEQAAHGADRRQPGAVHSGCAAAAVRLLHVRLHVPHVHGHHPPAQVRLRRALNDALLVRIRHGFGRGARPFLRLDVPACLYGLRLRPEDAGRVAVQDMADGGAVLRHCRRDA